MCEHIVTLLFLLCAKAVNGASKWPDHEWLIESTGVAWNSPELSDGYSRMEIWFVLFGSEFYVHLPLLPVFAVFLGLFAFYLLWFFRRRHSRT